MSEATQTRRRPILDDAALAFYVEAALANAREALADMGIDVDNDAQMLALESAHKVDIDLI